MNINAINPVFKGQSISISRNINQDRLYLYNEIMALLKKNSVPAVFSNDGIKLSVSGVPKKAEAIVKYLDENGIKFDRIA